MPATRLFGGVDFLDLLERALFVEAVGDGDGLAVVGEGDVFVAEIARGGGHFLDRVFAVAGGGVHLQVAANVAQVRRGAAGDASSAASISPVFSRSSGGM